MNFTVEQKKRIDYFRRSVRLDDVTTANDPAYKFTDDDLWGILEVSAPIHLGDSIDETPAKEFYFVLLLAKREIYYRLATTTAPFYPLSAEGASLQKNIRFDHYIKLVETVTKEYDNLQESKYGSGGSIGDTDPTGTGGVLTTYQSKVYGKQYAQRYDVLSDDIPITLEISGITTNSVNLDWTRFNSTMGSDFHKYEVFVREGIMVYDEYSPTSKNVEVDAVHVLQDVRKTKIRITDLEPNKEYYVLVKVTSKLGLTGFSQLLIKTLNDKVEDVNLNDMEIIIGGEV